MQVNDWDNSADINIEGVNFVATKDGKIRMTGATEQIIGYQWGEEKNEYTGKMISLNKFTGVVGEGINFMIALDANQKRINNYKNQQAAKEAEMTGQKPETPEDIAKRNVPDTMGNTAMGATPSEGNPSALSQADNYGGAYGSPGNPKVTSAKDLAIVSANVYDRSDWDVQLPDYIKKLSPEEISNLGLDPDQFYDVKSNMKAALYYNTETGEYILAFQGTQNIENGGLQDWLDNAAQAFGIVPDKYKDAEQLAKDVYGNSNIGDKLVITGHSLGGGLATAGGMVTGARTVTFDAAGVNVNTVGEENYQNTGNITAYDVSGEPLWMLQATGHFLIGIPTAEGTRINVEPVMPFCPPFYNPHDPIEMIKAL